jgi:hypothetical protein
LKGEEPEQGDQQRQPELSTAEADEAAKQPDCGAGSEPSGGIAGQTIEALRGAVAVGCSELITR